MMEHHEISSASLIPPTAIAPGLMRWTNVMTGGVTKSHLCLHSSRGNVFDGFGQEMQCQSLVPSPQPGVFLRSGTTYTVRRICRTVYESSVNEPRVIPDATPLFNNGPQDNDPYVYFVLGYSGATCMASEGSVRVYSGQDLPIVMQPVLRIFAANQRLDLEIEHRDGSSRLLKPAIYGELRSCVQLLVDRSDDGEVRFRREGACRPAAVKLIKTDRLPGGPHHDPSLLENPMTEISVQSHFTVEGLPHVVPLLEEPLIDSNLVFLVMPLLDHELLPHIPPGRGLNRDRIQRLFRQVVIAIAAMHQRQYCHRDISLENIMLNGIGTVQEAAFVIDMGQCARYEGVARPEIRAYKASYKSLEVMSRADITIDPKACDVWALGVVFYCMWVGSYPVDLNAGTLQWDQIEWYQCIRDGRLAERRVPRVGAPAQPDGAAGVPLREVIDPDAMDLLSRMLHPMFAHRITAEEILAHPFFQGGGV